MSIDDLWTKIEELLTPGVFAALRQPADDGVLRTWAEGAVEVPEQLIELYRRHEGTDHVGGGSGFCFIGNWYPLPVPAAIERYKQMRVMADMWGEEPLVPFAVGTDGTLLGVPPTGSDAVHIMFLDTPGDVYLPSIESLMRKTVAGLRGEDSEFRPNLTDEYLIWIDREFEAGYSV
jgi:hypothetical protein